MAKRPKGPDFARGVSLTKFTNGAMLHERFDAVPFFWTTQFDFTLNYIGHAEKWDRLDLDRRIEDHDCKLSFLREGETLAIATVGRDRQSLKDELAMERSNSPS
jgi:hypothetical protein